MEPRKCRPTRMVKPQGINTLVAHATTTSGLRLQFKERGIVLFAVGSVVAIASQDAYRSGMSSLGFRVFENGVEELVTDGESSQFMQFASAFPEEGSRFPLGIKVEPNDLWLIFIKNSHPATDFTPDFAVALAAYR